MKKSGAGRRRKIELALMRIPSKEWNDAWQQLERRSGDRDRMAEDPESGEVWQYMGTAKIEGRWEHEFRHRHHPALQHRCIIRVPAAPTWKPDQIL